MSSVFSKIVSGKIPSYKIFEDDQHLAFLDAFPLALGHVLVIPKHETDYIFNLGADEYLGLWEFTHKIAKAMDKVLDCKRIGISVIGLEVPHTHIHLVPINSIDDLNFTKSKKKFTNNQMTEIAVRINQAI